MINVFRIVTAPISFEKLLAGQMAYMQENGCKVTMISSGLAKLQKLSAAEGCDYFAVSMTRQITPLKDLKALYQLYRIMKTYKPDIVHTHTPKAGTLGMIAGMLAGIKVRMHTVAGMPLTEAKGIKKALLKRVEKITYSCATHIYPNSFKLANYIVTNRYCPAGKVKVLGKGSSNGIDVGYFKPANDFICEEFIQKEQLNISPGNFVYLFIGRIVTDKGINELVQAFEKLCLTNKDIRLLLVGPFENELDPVLPATKQAIKNNKAIISVGYKSDVRPYLAISHVLVFPSYREGFPNVPMQAGCFNLPAIVTDINGCNEIITEGVNGIIIPPKNMLALKNAMERMLYDDELRLSCGNKAREVIAESYSNKLIWSVILEEYTSAVFKKNEQVSLCTN